MRALSWADYNSIIAFHAKSTGLTEYDITDPAPTHTPTASYSLHGLDDVILVRILVVAVVHQDLQVGALLGRVTLHKAGRSQVK